MWKAAFLEVFYLGVGGGKSVFVNRGKNPMKVYRSVEISRTADDLTTSSSFLWGISIPHVFQHLIGMPFSCSSRIINEVIKRYYTLTVPVAWCSVNEQARLDSVPISHKSSAVSSNVRRELLTSTGKSVCDCNLLQV